MSGKAEGRSGRLALDTSALLTLFDGAPGRERVASALRDPQTILPWPTLVEAHYISLQRAGVQEATRRHALLTETAAEIAWEADEQLALTAARIKAAHRISLADAVIAAYAIRAGARLMHRDPDFELVPGLSTEPLPPVG